MEKMKWEKSGGRNFRYCPQRNPEFNPEFVRAYSSIADIISMLGQATLFLGVYISNFRRNALAIDSVAQSHL
jgi:hypothetical protein